MAGLLIIVAATAMPLIWMDNSWYQWLYAAGAVVLFIGRLMTPGLKEAPLRLRRLLRIETWGSLLFVAGAASMFWDSGSGRDWIAFTLAGGIIQVYTSIMIPRVQQQKD